ncbi:MAG: ATP-binding protein [Caldilineaceae bacterium]
MRNQPQHSRFFGNFPEADQPAPYEASIAYFPGSYPLPAAPLVSIPQAEFRSSENSEASPLWSAGVLHDFNNLLAIILSHSSIALSKLPADHPAHNYIERVIRATKRAADISSQLLVDVNRHWGEPTLIQMNQVVEDTVALMEAKLGPQTGLKLHLRENLMPITGNMTQMHQVVMNLILNAAEAIEPQPGRITITTGHFALTPTRQPSPAPGLEPGHYVYLQVTDTGEGMDQMRINHIFEPQFTTKPTGHGIGLTATLAIIQAHQGGIRAFSSPGRGTVFQVFLPAHTHLQQESDEGG